MGGAAGYETKREGALVSPSCTETVTMGVASGRCEITEVSSLMTCVSRVNLLTESQPTLGAG